MQNRREFLANSLNTIALANAAPAMNAIADIPEPSTTETGRVRVGIFYDSSFPSVDIAPLSREMLQSALESYEVAFLSLDELSTPLRLQSCHVFLNPFGSAFPKQAWRSIRQYLLKGGNWVNLGGIPLSVPVVKEGSNWRQESRQVAYHKAFYINQAFPVASRQVVSYQISGHPEGAFDFSGMFQAEEIYELYVRFTVTRDYPEDGTAGARDGLIRSLFYGVGEDGERLAAPFVEMDRLQGDCTGGRWALANFKGVISSKAIRLLVERAAQGATEFIVRPSFACYYGGELPSVTIQFRRPKGGVEKLIQGECQLDILDDKGQSVGSSSVRLNGTGTLATGFGNLASREGRSLGAGLYQITAKLRVASVSSRTVREIAYRTGFWSVEARTGTGNPLSGGKPLTADTNFLLRDGKPFPITGTTYMISDVHRKFLLEPNVFLWDRDFAAMKKAGVNMIRTGIWTGWKNYMLDAGTPNEVAMRSLDAFLMTARKYDIPVIFNLFAFLPEMWGGQNPYLDPRSVGAQAEFVKAFAHRYREMNDIAWDFINEPSFCSPEHLWSCRPNYDVYEAAAWEDWLKGKFRGVPGEKRETKLQEQWGLTPTDSLGLPPQDDFVDQHFFETRRPLKVVDYRLFAQDMFNGWVKEMTAAIRSNGNPHQLCTVGQDEGGVLDRPNPQFFGEVVDFTCNHTWWNNDDLLWDGVMTKVPDKPLVIEETGIMFYEKMSGGPWRTEEDARNLLERKLALAFGACGAGYIQWLWNTNVYMPTDLEVAIGFYRADGTAKPELGSFLALNRFLSKHRDLLTRAVEEEVLMVIPHSHMFSIRDFASTATKRCVRAMHYNCLTPMRAIGEYALQKQVNPGKLIILPSPRTFNQRSWEILLRMVQQGSSLLVTGIIDTDEHWRVVPRSKQLGFEIQIRPIAQEEFVLIGDREFRLSYRGEKMQRVEKALLAGEPTASVKVINHGKGKILWCPLPVEIAENDDATAALYEYALKQAAIAPTFTMEKVNPAVLIRPTVFNKATLYALVSETERDHEIRFTPAETKVPIVLRLPAQRAMLVLVDRQSGAVIGKSME
jgi:hypothetical protein